MDDVKVGVGHRGRFTGGSDAMEGSAVIILVSSELGGEVGVGRANGGRAQGRSICFLVKDFNMAGAKEGDALECKLMEA